VWIDSAFAIVEIKDYTEYHAQQQFFASYHPGKPNYFEN
jgi:hypothetical protein